MSYILVTGGAGYLGSHTVVELIQQGHKVVIADNLSNSSYDSIARIQILTRTWIPFFKVDLVDYADLVTIFDKYPIKSVIHFAGLKAVGESTKIPLTYYHNNIVGSINLLKAMEMFDVKCLVFSSSATVYGEVSPEYIPIAENCPLGSINPYGKTKLTIEYIIKDYFISQPDRCFAILRYFNPIGAHPSGLIGEDPVGIPNNLLPFLAQVAIGRQDELNIFGNDYDSKDGTPIRDYIHVVDLAKGHISALNYLAKCPKGVCREWNLGTGKGTTVIEIYDAFSKVIGRDLPYKVVGRRAGDVLNLTADPTRANKELNWRTELDISDACRDLWNWTVKNPSGFAISNYTSDFYTPEKTYENRLHKVHTFNGALEVIITNYGAKIVDTKLNGARFNLEFDNEEGYKESSKNAELFGATMGKFPKHASRGTTLSMIGKEESFQIGGQGYDKKLFWGPIVREDLGARETSLEFVLIDKGCDTKFLPGDLKVVVCYTIKDIGDNGGEIGVEYEVRLLDSSLSMSKKTEIKNQSYYWNISGEVASTEEARQELAKLDTRQECLQLVAQTTNAMSLIKFSTLTTEPAFLFYSGSNINLEGVTDSSTEFCLDSLKHIYHPLWSISLTKPKVYGSRTVYRFEQEL